jgi:hypothetical protein
MPAGLRRRPVCRDKVNFAKLLKPERWRMITPTFPMIAPGFQMLAGSLSPSHAYSHVEDFGIPVTVHGM